MINRKICPNCGSDDVVPISGTDQWMCKECSYSGFSFTEEPIVGANLDEEYDEDLEEMPVKSSKLVKKSVAKKSSISKKLLTKKAKRRK